MYCVVSVRENFFVNHSSYTFRPYLLPSSPSQGLMHYTCECFAFEFLCSCRVGFLTESVWLNLEEEKAKIGRGRHSGVS